MTEFCGLSSKMYALKVDGEDNIKKSKGVKRNVVAKTISFNDYFNCLFNQTQISRVQNTIRSHLHNLYSLRQRRIALSSHDAKRYINTDDVTKTLPYGHRDVPIV